MKSIADHPQIPYYRCKKCKRSGAAAENGKVLIVPPNVFVRSGDKPSKAPIFNKCSNCGCEINTPAHYQVVPCIGDVVRFPVDSQKPGGITQRGKVLNIHYDKVGLPSLLIQTDNGILTAAVVMGIRLEHCYKWDETN